MEEKNMVEFEDVDNVDEIEETEENTPRRSGIGTFGAMADRKSTRLNSSHQF